MIIENRLLRFLGILYVNGDSWKPAVAEGITSLKTTGSDKVHDIWIILNLSPEVICKHCFQCKGRSSLTVFAPAKLPYTIM